MRGTYFSERAHFFPMYYHIISLSLFPISSTHFIVPPEFILQFKFELNCFPIPKAGNARIWAPVRMGKLNFGYKFGPGNLSWKFKVIYKSSIGFEYWYLWSHAKEKPFTLSFAFFSEKYSNLVAYLSRLESERCNHPIYNHDNNPMLKQK